LFDTNKTHQPQSKITGRHVSTTVQHQQQTVHCPVLHSSTFTFYWAALSAS